MMSGKNSSCVRVFIFSSSSSVLCFYKHRDSGGAAACVHIVYSCITVVSSLLFIFNFSKNKKVCDLKPTSVPIQISPNVSLNISSLYHHLRLIEAGLFFCYLTFNVQTCGAVQVYVVCCFPGCRETHYQTADQKRSIGHTYLNKLYLIYLVSCSSYLIYKIFMPFHSALSFLFPSFVRIVWSSSFARVGHSGGTTPGMRHLISDVRLCKCPPYIHHQTIKIALQPSITSSLSPPRLLLSQNHLEPLVNRTRPE